jgi:biopolymer transport protein ExbB
MFGSPPSLLSDGVFRRESLLSLFAVVIIAFTAISWLTPTLIRAQEDAASGGEESRPPIDAAEPAAAANGSTVAETADTDEEPNQLKLLWLIRKGGLLMVPILLMSVLVVALVIERFISLRRAKVLPSRLVQGLGKAANTAGTFDPRTAYRLCQQYPSAASSVVRAMLLKVGRPHSEVEHAVAEASQREAERMYANIRWLHLAAAVTPLMGLFGTVWGMIRAFFETTQLEAGQNKADFLASGIYVALVTTLGGLSVAIPAAILAHYFEGRIQTLFHQIDELLFNLLPQIERYEGKLRVSPQTLVDGDFVEKTTRSAQGSGDASRALADERAAARAAPE